MIYNLFFPFFLQNSVLLKPFLPCSQPLRLLTTSQSSISREGDSAQGFTTTILQNAMGIIADHPLAMLHENAPETRRVFKAPKILAKYQKKVSVFWFLFGSPSSFFIFNILNEWYFCINSLFTHSKEWELSTAEIRRYYFPKQMGVLRWRWRGSFGLEGRHCRYSAEIPESVRVVVSNMCERVH